MPRFIHHFRKAISQAIDDDIVNTAKATAYSGILMLFPALVVFAMLLAQVPEGTTLVGEFRATFEQILPLASMDMLQSTLQAHQILSLQLLLSCSGLSIFAALGVMLSLMEGFRRAYRLPLNEWGFWERRARALLLIPIALIPLALATLAVIFGRQIETWMIDNSDHELHAAVLLFWRMVRWGLAIVTSITVLCAVYHFGTMRREHWAKVAPGAVASALGWFPATLAFGWYVTRIADYSMYYGSFGAGIATLVWLYITSFSALLGAELNGVLFKERRAQDAPPSASEPRPHSL